MIDCGQHNLVRGTPNYIRRGRSRGETDATAWRLCASVHRNARKGVGVLVEPVYLRNVLIPLTKGSCCRVPINTKRKRPSSRTCFDYVVVLDAVMPLDVKNLSEHLKVFGKPKCQYLLPASVAAVCTAPINCGKLGGSGATNFCSQQRG